MNDTGDLCGFLVYLSEAASGGFWSLGALRASRAPDRIESWWEPGRFELVREGTEIEARLEICVSPHSTLEIRRVALRNRSARHRTLDVTTFAEVVLSRAAAHAAHPVFSKLFIQTEWRPEARALLACRRPRGVRESSPCLVHAALEPGTLEYQSDRESFIGRGRSLAAPLALCGRPLTGTVGNVLDPALSLRRRVALPPEGSISLSFVLGAASDRQTALALIPPLLPEGAVEDAFAGARAQAREQIRTPADAERWQTQAGGMLCGDPSLRASPRIPFGTRGTRAELSTLGIRPERRLAVLDARSPEGRAVLADTVRAYEYWRSLGLPIDLGVVLGDGRVEIRSGSILRPEKVAPEVVALLLASADLFLPRADQEGTEA